MPATEKLEIPIISSGRRPRDPLAKLRKLGIRYSDQEYKAIMTTFADLLYEQIAVHHGRRRCAIRVDYISTDVFRGETPVFPSLLGPETEFRMTRQHALAELLTLLEIRDSSDIFAGTYVYSVSVIRPGKMHEILRPEVLKGVPPANHAQVSFAYVPHKLLSSLTHPHSYNIL